MKQTAVEWIDKAEADFATMQRESRVRKNPNYDAACFHAQQCAEKYIKARLCEAGISFGKVHDLVALLEQVLTVEPGWEKFREDLAYLSDFAVSFRYPGESADKNTSKDAVKRCTRFRKAARLALNLEEDKHRLF
jgi:HEPN domain-containing protein